MVEIERASNGFIATVDKEKIVITDVLKLMLFVSTLESDNLDYAKNMLDGYDAVVEKNNSDERGICSEIVIKFTKK